MPGFNFFPAKLLAGNELISLDGFFRLFISEWQLEPVFVVAITKCDVCICVRGKGGGGGGGRAGHVLAHVLIQRQNGTE